MTGSGIALLAGMLIAIGAHAGLDDLPARLIEAMTRKFGPEVPQRLASWQRVLRQGAEGSEQRELQLANRYFNAIPYFRDADHWMVSDYWASPVETVSSHGGDCEDYAIGKYFTLKERRIPLDKLRITYVRHLALKESHMVLVYYPTPDADPLVLDNLTGDIQPASRRTELAPVYSFNDEDVRGMEGGERNLGSPRQIRLWSGLLNRMEREYRP
ncbi:MAG: transglutaminase-like cysteine peptidase [Betaproteobacteria bacterium]|nr:transglutaminase-like cysteine peptidase [Betaproteobacteria bacterium]